jgi:hypothetical protein
LDGFDDADLYFNLDGYPIRHPHVLPDAFGDIDGFDDIHAHVYLFRNLHFNAYVYPHIKSNGHFHFHFHIDLYVDAHCDPDVHPNSDLHSHALFHFEPDHHRNPV